MKHSTITVVLGFCAGCYVQTGAPAAYPASPPPNTVYVAPSPTTAPAPTPSLVTAPSPNAQELRAYRALTATERRRAETRSDIRMQTTSWEPTPSLLDTSTQGPFVLSSPTRVVLAGDASGSQPWRIDNFVLVEVLDARMQRTRAALVGQTEPAILDGSPIAQLGTAGFSPPPTDISSLLPIGVPFSLRVSALDYGGGAYVSDVWVAPTAPATTPMLGARALTTTQLFTARSVRSGATRTDIRMQTTQWEPHPTALAEANVPVAILFEPRRVVLAGDANGAAPWRVDNFVLLEVLDSTGARLAAGLVGYTEPALLNGVAIPHLVPDSFDFAGGVDISALLPIGRPFQLRATALDYGGPAHVTDVWLVVR